MNMTQQYRLYSSGQEYRQYESIIDKLERWTVVTWPQIMWRKVRIDAFISKKHALCFKAFFLEPNKKTYTPFPLCLKDSETLETLLMYLYDRMLNIHNEPTWNKIRIVFDKKTKRRGFACQMDHDYEWLEALTPESDEYMALDLGTELKILSWEGLPKHHPRPWNRLNRSLRGK